MPDFLSMNDLPLRAWLRLFRNEVNASGAGFGVDAGTVAEVGTKTDAFDAALVTLGEAKNALRAAAEAKNIARAEIKALVRAVARHLQAQAGMTDEARARFRLPVRDRKPTRTAAPATRPLLQVDAPERWTHRLRFADEATPTRRAKPPGARGLEVWVAYGPVAPADPAAFSYLGTATASPHRVKIAPARAGEMAHYLARWVSPRGETGPWSETASATVTG